MSVLKMGGRHDKDIEFEVHSDGYLAVVIESTYNSTYIFLDPEQKKLLKDFLDRDATIR